jgi:hypothetical protein
MWSFLLIGTGESLLCLKDIVHALSSVIKAMLNLNVSRIIIVIIIIHLLIFRRSACDAAIRRSTLTT